MASLPRPEGAVQGQGAHPQPRFGNGSAPGQRLKPGLPATGWIQSRIAARTKVTACSPRPLPPKKKPPEGRGGGDTERSELISKAKVAISVRRCEATSPPPASPSPPSPANCEVSVDVFLPPVKTLELCLLRRCSGFVVSAGDAPPAKHRG